MISNTANGREAVPFSLSADNWQVEQGSTIPSPIYHTMGVPSPIYKTQPTPSATAVPAADSVALASSSTTTASTEAPPSDPLFEQQWHFDRLGDILKVWEEFTGVGTHVGLFDDGFYYYHPDLEANYDRESHVWIFDDSWELDPFWPAVEGNPHGTSVGGLIVAARNGEGTVGVSYNATLTAVPIFSGITDINESFEGFIQALHHLSDFDVVNHSWGTTPAFWQELLEQDAAINAEWQYAADHGRDGLGTVVVKAAGNDNMNANGEGTDVTRATIIVGAYDFTGEASYYSNYGANLLVSAPSSGDMRNFFSDPGPPMIDPGLVTTDLPGQLGYNIDGNPFAEDDYTNQFGGTSGATPIVVGVVSLMLDANENLGWRDVQNILAYSAREVGSGIGGAQSENENYSWFYNKADNWNGGGLHFSQDYGFGAVDAYNAVRMAEVWTLFGAPQTSANESSYSSTFDTPTAINDLKNTDITFTFGDVSSFDVEYVNVDLVLSHPSTSQALQLNFGSVHSIVTRNLADLTIELISPDGTTVELADFNIDISVDGGQVHIIMGANSFRGEDASGTWTLRIADHYFDDNGPGTLTSATVTLHGRDGDSGGNDAVNDIYHYTNEVFATLEKDSSRIALSDLDGGTDWLNLAAMSGDLVIRLDEGQTSTGTAADGVRDIFTIATGTVIENAVTGDGNDKIFGNGAVNVLHGMRGNDTISGGAGDDTLSGGAGNDILTGGADQDIFLFDRALNALTNVDVITDFSSADDTFWLDVAVFSGLVTGALDSDGFYAGSGAYDASDRIIYDSVTGALYFDADGTGDTAAVQFATLLGTHADLSFSDFLIVAQTAEEIVTGNDYTSTVDPTVDNSTDAERRGAGTIYGTNDLDNIRGDDGDNRIFGLDGDDIILAGEGDNVVDGGMGLDTIFSGDGDDILIGGGSYSLYGDNIYGGGGNDIIYGSDNQVNDDAWRMAIFGRGDTLGGQAGDDRIYGLNGDDLIVGHEGDDYLDGGNGSDTLAGESGDDRLLPGYGEVDSVFGGEGDDTVVLLGPSSEYRWFMVNIGTNSDFGETVFLERISSGGLERVGLNAYDIENLEFTNETIDISRDLVIHAGTESVFDQPTYEDAAVEVDGYEIGAIVFRADDVSVVDIAEEDKLQAVSVEKAYGNVDITSDALNVLKLVTLGVHYFNEEGIGNWVHEPMTGTVTVHAAEGERHLNLELLLIDLADGARIIDDTATSVRLTSQTGITMGYIGDMMNGAEVNDYNVSFESATSIEFGHFYGAEIKWNIPNVTTVTSPRVQFSEITHITQGGQVGRLLIETPLDDIELATAGGTTAYSFTGGTGKEMIRFGNIGDVNVSNDGTTGPDADTNDGQGLQGTINLSWGDDEARILGSSAFKEGGILDGGESLLFDFGEQFAHETEVNGDTLRMTFAVADAIGDISGHIKNFEILQLDTTSATGNVVDVANFDNLQKVAITGGTEAGGDNTIFGLASEATVTIRSVSEAVQEGPSAEGSRLYVFDTFGNDFGTVRIDTSGDGDDDTLNLNFIGLQSDGVDTGTIQVVGAETVKIVTSSRDTSYHNDPFNPNVSNPPLAFEPTDAFAQVLQLDGTKSVYLSGNTGWDLTVEGTDISHVTLIDASGVKDDEIAFYGNIGAVKAIAQTDEAVTFIGGWGDDEFTGGDGNDTLAGGARGNDILDGARGTDRAVFAGQLSDYVITINDRVVTLTSNLDGSVDTVTNVELFQFSDGTVTAGDLGVAPSNEAPTDIALSNATVAEFADDGTVVGTLSATDPDTGESFTYELTDDADGRFAIQDGKIVVADSAALDFEIDTSHEVKVKVTDSGGLTYEKAFTIAVGDVNETPTVALTPVLSSIEENTPTTSPIKVADIVVTDGDSNPAYRSNNLSLTGRDAGLFQIMGMALFLKAGVQLDYEQRQSLEVTVQVDDPTIGSGPDGSVSFTLAITDVVHENAILGTPGNNDLRGTNRDDYFDGRGGRDTFRGYRGDDTYVVDSTNDSVIERRHEGTDTVLSSANHTLADNVENLVLTGNDSINGTGNSEDNVIAGNDGNNRLYGGSGDDVIEGGAGDDVMDGGIGVDTVSYAGATGPVKVSLGPGGAPQNRGTEYWGWGASQDTGDGYDTLLNFENLTGSAYDDWLSGNKGDNVIDGGIGADCMAGDKGNDTYIVDNAGDLINEAANQGIDTAKSSVSYTLAANVENLFLTGSAAIDGAGNGLANTIKGNGAGNTLSGLGGEDRLYGGSGVDKILGGLGNDWLKGGDGADTFVFDTALSSRNYWGASNRDTIVDYSVADDTIWLDNAIFAALFGEEGSVLSANQFWTGAGAHDASDRIIYNPWTGVLSYDSNGSAHGGAVEIAVLSKGLAMTHAEFVIV